MVVLRWLPERNGEVGINPEISGMSQNAAIAHIAAIATKEALS
jgi:hypothetical protein